MSESRVMDEDVRKNMKQKGKADSEGQDEVVSQGLASNKADNLSPGEMLREARLAHKYSVADICAQTMLSTHAVEALENDRFEELAQPVFVRGYYRKCAEVLDIDADRLLNAYAASGAVRVSSRHDSIETSIQVVPANVTPEKRRSFRLVFLIILLIIVGLAGYLYWSQSLRDVLGNDATTGISLMHGFESSATTPASDNTVSTQITPPLMSSDKAARGDDEILLPGADEGGKDQGTQVMTPADAESLPDVGTANQTDEAETFGPATDSATAASAQSTQQPVEVAISQSDKPVANGPDAVPDAGADVANAAAAAQTVTMPTAGSDTSPAVPAISPTALTLEFDDRSWVSVHDASGRQLLVGIYEHTTQTVDGTPPYKLVIGFAPGVSVSFGGEPVQFDIAGNNTARFAVGADNS